MNYFVLAGFIVFLSGCATTEGRLGGLIAGLGVDLIDASFSRDEEREADALGVGYMVSTGFDPQGAIRLQEKLLKVSRGSLLPFLSSHPSGQERIESLKALIREKSYSSHP